MTLIWRELRPLMGHIGLFSLCINLLSLAPALFMLQVFERVLPANSQETLLVLLAGTALALIFLLLLDCMRQGLQAVLGSLIEERLAPQVMAALVASVARNPHAAGTESLRDVALLKQAFASPGLAALMDAPWAPLYVGVIWTFHPALGWGALFAVCLMLCLAWLNDRSSRSALAALQSDGRRAARYVDSSMRNAEVLQALGMTDALISRWRALQHQVASMQKSAIRGNTLFTPLARFARQAIQVAMLSLGAWQVLTGHA